MKKPLIDLAPTAARINVTPIIDVALVLVIVLLITAPMIAVTDMEISLPQAQTRSIEDDARVNITLGMSGELAVDETTIRADEFPVLVARRLEKKGDNLLFVVRADKGIPYDAVEALIKQTRNAGAKRIAIATEQHGRDSDE